jgi:hypothetical protein
MAISTGIALARAAEGEAFTDELWDEIGAGVTERLLDARPVEETT